MNKYLRHIMYIYQLPMKDFIVMYCKHRFKNKNQTIFETWQHHTNSWLLTLCCFASFCFRVPRSQGGEWGPGVLWVAGSFLQWNLGQCLPQPYGWCDLVRDLQTAWLWGQWEPQHLCSCKGRVETPVGGWNPVSKNRCFSLAVSIWSLGSQILLSKGRGLYHLYRCRWQSWNLIFISKLKEWITVYLHKEFHMGFI